MNLLLYGPPAVGKSAVGAELARRLGREFVDADALIEARAGRPIPAIFAEFGEPEFRRLEAEVCAEIAARSDVVAALGGGALLDSANRARLEKAGLVVCLQAAPAALLARAQAADNRPLLSGGATEERLAALLEARRALYDSFPVRVDTTAKTAAQAADEIARLLAPCAIPVNAPGLKHEILLGYGLLETLPVLLAERGLAGPVVVVADSNVLEARALSWPFPVVPLPSGEAHKNLETVRGLYDFFLAHGLDRGGIVVAVGGGVAGDVAGFAAATYMRGVRWVAAPTTLLAMVDASLGGKTGVDLPQGKNLVGAFHPPALVVSDPLALSTLPPAERVAGMAEVVKHGIIGDPALFEALEASAAFGSLPQIRQAIEVKVRVVEADPFEKGLRAVLNLGHTVGHGVEAASGYALRHGEAVAIGLAAEARLARAIGLCDSALVDRIEAVLQKIGLPVRYRGLDPAAVRRAMSSDKKKSGGKLKFALPEAIGRVRVGCEVEEGVIEGVLESIGFKSA